MNLHEFIDFHYGSDGDRILRERLEDGLDASEFVNGETLLHVAARRRRKEATELLLEYGADIDAKNDHGKTAFVHAARRGFDDITGVLATRGATTDMNDADRLAVLMSQKKFDDARSFIEVHPECVCTGNPEEDRLLADLAGRNHSEPVIMLIEAGASLVAPALDDGTPLHQAAWFGQPENARILIGAGAPLNIFDKVHASSPIGWAVHGSRYSGGAEERQEVYAELVSMLLEAGSALYYPDEPQSDTYLKRLRTDATPRILELLPETL